MCLSYFLRAYPCDTRAYQAAKESSYDPLVDLLESIERFLRSIDIYTQIHHTPALDEMIVKIIAELLCTLGLATKRLMQGRLRESVLVDLLPHSVQFRGIRR